MKLKNDKEAELKKSKDQHDLQMKEKEAEIARVKVESDKKIAEEVKRTEEALKKENDAKLKIKE